MGIQIEFGIGGQIYVRCTTTNVIDSSYDDLETFQLFYGYISKKKKLLNIDEYNEWENKYFDYDKEKFKKKAYKYIDSEIGLSDFTELPKKYQKFLQKEHGYFLSIKKLK